MDQSLRIAFLTNGHNNREGVMRVFLYGFVPFISTELQLLSHVALFKILKVAQQLQPSVFRLMRGL